MGIHRLTDAREFTNRDRERLRRIETITICLKLHVLPFPDLAENLTLPTQFIFWPKVSLLTFSRTEISQKWLLLLFQNKIHNFRLEYIEFYHFICLLFIKYSLRYWFSKRNATFFLAEEVDNSSKLTKPKFSRNWISSSFWLFQPLRNTSVRKFFVKFINKQVICYVRNITSLS